MSTWQDISTAPKDGRLILGYDAKFSSTLKHATQFYGAGRDTDGDVYRVAPFEVICWIESERWVMVLVSGDNFQRVKRNNSHWARSQGSWTATHWMPLPDPPKDASA